MPLSQDYTFQLGDTGEVLNTDDTTVNFVDITKVGGLDSAPPRSTERDHEGTDGGFMDAEFEKGRPITLDGTVYAINTDLQSYLDNLKANWAVSRTPIPLYIKQPGIAERVLFVKPLGCRYDFEQAARLDRTDIQFSGFAEDPRLYEANNNSVNIYQGELVATGRSYSRGYPYGYGSSTQVVGTYLTVGGNRPTPPVFTLFGPIDRPRIINETTGEEMFFDIRLGATDSLVVDVKNRTVELNGENRRSALREPQWTFLQPGQNYIRYRAESANTPNRGVTLNANPDFDTTLSPWTAVGGGGIVLDTTLWHVAPQSLQLAGDGVSANPETRTELIPVESGTTYQCDVWVNCNVTRNITVGMNWYDATNTLVNSTTLNGITGTLVTANTWTNLVYSAKAPTNAVSARMKVVMVSTPANTTTLNIDEAQFYGMYPNILNVQYRAAWR